MGGGPAQSISILDPHLSIVAPPSHIGWAFADTQRVVQQFTKGQLLTRDHNIHATIHRAALRNVV
jgi:hypothetical protein